LNGSTLDFRAFPSTYKNKLMHRLIKDAILEIVPGTITKKRRHKIIEIKVLPHQNLRDATITIVEKDPIRGIDDLDLEIVSQNLGKKDIEIRDPDPRNEGIVIDRETEVETIVKRDIKIEGEVDLDHETI